MGAIPSGKGGERFPQLSPTQKAGFGGIWGVGRPAATTCCCSGRGGVRERKGGWGRRGRRAQDIGLVAPGRLARHCCRASACGTTVRATTSPATSVATLSPGHLSRQWCWRDKPTLSRHCVPKPSKDFIFHLVAWQVLLVAPLPVARQISFVAPPELARQAQNSAALPCFCCCSLLLVLSRCCLLLLLVLKLLMVQ